MKLDLFEVVDWIIPILMIEVFVFLQIVLGAFLLTEIGVI